MNLAPSTTAEERWVTDGSGSKSRCQNSEALSTAAMEAQVCWVAPISGDCKSAGRRKSSRRQIFHPYGAYYTKANLHMW